jgi:periplasmic protein CpxP/Spy
MKKTILLAAMFVFASAGYAQTQASTDAKTPQERATEFTSWIDKTVQLTPDQKAKVQDVNLKYAQMKQDARAKDQGDKQAMRKDMTADNEAQDTELKGILTADQYTAYTAAKKQKMEDMRAKRRAN